MEEDMKIHDLPLEERIKLVEDIWDSIAAEQEALPVTAEQRRELDRRLERYRVDGDRGTPACLFSVYKGSTPTGS
jgi:putative addiction module component (TIGR02574 family)